MLGFVSASRSCWPGPCLPGNGERRPAGFDAAGCKTMGIAVTSCFRSSARMPRHSPGTADGPGLDGHNWVCVAMLMRHCYFGVIAMPLLSHL
jgi:hypothetical protein